MTDSNEENIVERFKNRAQAREIVEEMFDVWSNDINRWFELIRKFYDVYKVDKYHDVNMVEWYRVFTPIENALWSAIRYYGVPLYPQYPALDYFLDFADPVKKIGVEADGKDYHDESKDMYRDLQLHDDGWKIFRIKGSEAMKPEPNFEDVMDDSGSLGAEGMDWISRSGDGVICAISQVFYGNQITTKNDVSFLKKSLQQHCYFPLGLED